MPTLLARLLDEPWFALPPPKSTGREQFHLDGCSRACAATSARRRAGHAARTQRGRASPRHCAPPARHAARAGLRRRRAQPAAAAAHCRAPAGCGGRIHGRPRRGSGFRRGDGLRVAGAADPGRAPGNLPSVTGARGPRVLGVVSGLKAAPDRQGFARRRSGRDRCRSAPAPASRVRPVGRPARSGRNRRRHGHSFQRGDRLLQGDRVGVGEAHGASGPRRRTGPARAGAAGSGASPSRAGSASSLMRSARTGSISRRTMSVMLLLLAEAAGLTGSQHRAMASVGPAAAPRTAARPRMPGHSSKAGMPIRAVPTKNSEYASSSVRPTSRCSTATPEKPFSTLPSSA